MKTSITEVSITFEGGNKVAFTDDTGVDLSKLKVVSNILREEIKSVSPEKEPRKAA